MENTIFYLNNQKYISIVSNTNYYYYYYYAYIEIKFNGCLLLLFILLYQIINRIFNFIINNTKKYEHVCINQFVLILNYYFNTL